MNSMNEHTWKFSPRRPFGVVIIAIINGLGFLVTLLFWAFVLFKKLVPPPGDLAGLAE